MTSPFEPYIPSMHPRISIIKWCVWGSNPELSSGLNGCLVLSHGRPALLGRSSSQEIRLGCNSAYFLVLLSLVTQHLSALCSVPYRYNTSQVCAVPCMELHSCRAVGGCQCPVSAKLYFPCSAACLQWQHGLHCKIHSVALV